MRHEARPETVGKVECGKQELLCDRDLATRGRGCMAHYEMDHKKLMAQLQVILTEAQRSDEDPITISIDKDSIELMLSIVNNARAGSKGKSENDR